ncbi:MAG: Gfo/Idh/MocA family oxidoreductase, partial [Bryobacterales bacterium]|nr:Gfo/Idh/MocA family oxidoreductase [Bryobacterales bacterium]
SGLPMYKEHEGFWRKHYLEKPVTHRLEESESLLRAVERSGRVVASGTQQRSWNHYLEAKQLVDEGVLGRVTFVRCHWSQDYSRMRSEPSPSVDMAQLHWERWLGPAPCTAFDPDRFRFWRFFWDYGGGSVTDLMTHWIDVVQWFLDSPRAERVQAASATYVQGWMEAPDTVVATMEYPEGYMAAFEGNMTFGLLGCGIEFRGDRAMMSINRVGYWVYEEGTKPLESVTLPEPKYFFERSDNTPRDERVDGSGTLDNVRNWVDCVRDRKQPNAHIRAAVESAATSHWVNRAVRMGTPLTITP